MSFALIVIGSLIALGIVAALLSRGGDDEPIVQKEGDCGSCSSKTECKLVELKEAGRKKKKELCHLTSIVLLVSLLLLAGC